MAKRFPFPGIPNGWYAVAASDEIPRGKAVARRYFDRELVIYRTASGAVRVADAFCPHLGAHLGRVGRIEGERLRCGVHGLEYDLGGACVSIPSGAPPPRRAQLRCWDVREQNGWILAWFDPSGATARWELPPLDDAGWNRPRWRLYPIATTPQETTENSVDFAHFTQLHGFVDGSIARPIAIEGAFLSTAYRAHRPLGVPGLPKYKLPVCYDVKVWGLGYSQVDVSVPRLGLDARVWVLPVPIDENHIELRLATSTKNTIPLIGRLTRRIVHRIVCAEVDEDLDVWNYKAYLEKPALMKSDGPIGEYRRWARQFYPEPRAEARDESRPGTGVGGGAPTGPRSDDPFE
jgi:nitrite reductase/ring-hydroxylating ferredoxin subunit